MADETPGYDAYQSAFHEAFRPELYGIVDALPIPDGGAVIDVPCGNGYYTRRLAERLPPNGRLTAVDTCEAYLEQTRRAVAESGREAEVEVRQADALHLPYPDASFDFVWCAQSLISLDPTPAVREMSRVTKPGGRIAVLEVDEFHHVLLPWPVELEAAFPQAVLAASMRRYGDGAKLAPARRLRRLMQQCGWRAIRRRTHTFERSAPFVPFTQAFLARHLEFQKSFVYPHLPAALRPTFDRLADPDADESFFRRADAELGCVNTVYLASRTADRSRD
jgi:ubiquinone/menaquinone biosynthesis C-methylase UbiE